MVNKRSHLTDKLCQETSYARRVMLFQEWIMDDKCYFSYGPGEIFLTAQNLFFNLVYLFMIRHEIHSINTHSAERRSIKTDKTERFTRHWSRQDHRATDTFCNCVGEMLFLINRKILDIIYLPSPCKMNFYFFPFFHET